MRYRPNWYRVFGVAAILFIAHLLTGCTVVRTENLQVHLVCRKDVLDHEFHFNQDVFNHNRCDLKKNQLFFSYSFGAH